MKIKRVGIDLDNTVADFVKGASPFIEARYGLKADISRKANRIEDIFGINYKNRPKCITTEVYEKHHVFRHLPKLEDDIEQLTHLLVSQDGLDHRTYIYFITARTRTPIIEKDTWGWLIEHNFVFRDVFFTEDKTSLCMDMGIDVMIEDEMYHTIDLLYEGVNVILRDQPWNRNLAVNESRYRSDNGEIYKGKIKRVYGWREILKATEEFLK